MKKFLVFLVPIIILSACRTTKDAPQVMDKNAKRVSYTILNGYFLKNSYRHTDEAKIILLDSQAAMDSLLGVAKTMNNKIDIPDFTKNTVGIVVCKPTNMKTDIKLNYVKASEKTLYISAGINQYEERSFLSAPILVFEFARQANKTPQITVSKQIMGEAR